mgnify:CR=1 FL=1
MKEIPYWERLEALALKLVHAGAQDAEAPYSMAPETRQAIMRNAEENARACEAGAEALREHPLAVLVERVHAGNDRWWRDLATGERVTRNVGELLMLTVSEIAEAMEGHRKNLNDAHLPHRKSIEVELADAVIRIFDMAGGLGLDLAGAFEEKLAYNATRADHTHEARRAPGGKAY